MNSAIGDAAPAALIGPYGAIFVAGYILLLLIVGVVGRFARKEETLADHYLGGRTLGPFVLFLTLYATQYSGNTFIGFAGQAYRRGYGFFIVVTALMAVVGGYLLFAPRLHRLSKRHGFVTIGDYFDHRFRLSSLSVAVSVICIIALCNYILTNLKAIGYIVEVASGGAIGFAQGIFILSVVMVFYETMGGLRSVAWTDVLQGLLLLFGCVIIFAAIEYQYGGLRETSRLLLESRSDFWTPPSFAGKCSMLSTILLFFFGVSMYPHAIQRIYAARDSKTLRLSFQLMVFMPLITSFFMVVVGLVGAAKFSGLSTEESERVALFLLLDMAKSIPGIQALLVVFITAAVAAIMSTVDSALLAASSLFTQDLFRRLSPGSTDRRLARVGKIFSWVTIGIMSFLAVELPETIWRLIEIKLELLCQVAPAIFLGIHFRWLNAYAVFSGLIAGVALSVSFQFAEMLGWITQTKPLGFHAGIWGLLVNILLVVGLSWWINARSDTPNGGRSDR